MTGVALQHVEDGRLGLPFLFHQGNNVLSACASLNIFRYREIGDAVISMLVDPTIGLIKLKRCQYRVNNLFPGFRCSMKKQKASFL